MTFSALGGACDIDGGVISAAIPNLHRYEAGSYNGTIIGEIGTSGQMISRKIQIGPQRRGRRQTTHLKQPLATQTEMFPRSGY